MPIMTTLLAIQVAATSPTALPACQAKQLHVTTDARDGAFNGMSHGGIELSIRNTGPDCMLTALPMIQLRDAHGKLLPAARKAPIGMHPGPVMLPVRLAGGHRATTDIRWVSGPVYPRSRSVTARSVILTIGGATLRAPLVAKLYGEAGKPVTFEQPPLQAAEGMAAG